MKKQNVKSKRWLKALILAAAILFTAQACNLRFGGGGQQERAELVWWKVFDSPAVVQPLIQDFQREFPGLQVRYVEKDIATYEDELIDALAAGEGPDIFTIHNDWLPKHQNKIAPFPDGLVSTRKLNEQFAEVVSFDLTAEGRVYALPLSVDVLTMYYNRDLLASAGIARPPATWEELVTITERITRRDAQGNFLRSAVALGTAENINRAPDILGLFMLQNGTQFYSADRRSSTIDRTFTDNQGVRINPGAQALTFYTQFANPAKNTYTWNARSNNSIEAFASSQAAMIFSYAYLRPVLADRAPFLNYDVAPVPQISTNNIKVNYANYWAEAVAQGSEHKEAAWQFLEFITRPEILAKYYEVVEQPSSRVDLLEQQIPDPEIGVFAENVLSAKSFYKPDSDAVESIFVQMIQDTTLRNATPEEAVRAAAQKINLLLRN